MRITEWARNARNKLAVAGVAVATTLATAQSEVVDPVELGDIVFPLDLTSIAVKVGAAGALMVGLWATYKIGFRLINKFVGRMGSAI